MDDMALLREYAVRNSEAAFAELVSRRVNFVYSAALRQLRDPHLAEEVTQAVFIILAQKAGKISAKTILAGWLFRTTRFAAQAQRRAAAKRRQRELEAQMQAELQAATPDPVWEQMSPLLDEALATLGETDRQAVLLRFFENQSLADVGKFLGTGEDTARKRVSRALEKLHRFFNRRGISSTTAILAGSISANAVQAAPVTLAKSVAAMALAKGAVAGSSTLTLIQGALKIMAWTKVKTTIVTGVVALLAVGTTTVAFKEVQKYQMYSWRTLGIDRSDITKLDTWPAQVWINPAKNVHLGNQFAENENGQVMGRNVPFSWLLRDAYGKTQPWMIIPSDFTDNRTFDFIANLDHGSLEALQREINKTFGCVVRREPKETNVLVLKIGKAGVRGLKPPTAHPTTELRAGTDTLTWIAQPLSTLDIWLEGFFHTPVVDETGLKQKYDFSIQWDKQWWFDNRNDPEGLKQKILDQLGLELVPTNMPIEMLVVEKAK